MIMAAVGAVVVAAISVIFMPRIAHAQEQKQTYVQFNLLLPYGGNQEVTTTLLGDFKLTEKELGKQKVMVNSAEEAMALMKIPNITVDIVLYEDPDGQAFPEHITHLLPKIGGGITPYMIKLGRKVLEEDDWMLRHVVLHQFARLKNGDFNRYTHPHRQKLSIQEQEKEGEKTLFDALGWEKYKKLLLERYNFEKKLYPNSIKSERSFLKDIQFRLDIFPQDPEDKDELEKWSEEKRIEEEEIKREEKEGK